MEEKANKSFEMEDAPSDLGKVEISPEVIEVIASIATTEVDGVASMHSHFASGVVERISRKSYGKGVKVDLTDDGIIIDITLHVNYGVSIPDVCKKVQDNIVQTLRTMTALEVSSINIHVIGVQFEQPDQDQAE